MITSGRMEGWEMCICVWGAHTGEGVLYGILGGYTYCQKKIVATQHVISQCGGTCQNYSQNRDCQTFYSMSQIINV